MILTRRTSALNTFRTGASVLGLLLVGQCGGAAIVEATPANPWVKWEAASGGNDHWYRAVRVTTLVSWTEAFANAPSLGGYLASITSAAENAFVFSLVSSPEFFNGEKGATFGAYQPAGSSEPGGGWTWVNGEPWSYVNWTGGQPDNGGGGPAEDIAHFWNGPGWNDHLKDAAQFRSFVIERETQPVLATFDISKDFSIASNPNGVWSYGWKSTLAGDYTPFVRSHASTFSNGVPFEVWGHESDLPAVACNTSTNTGIGDGGAAVFPPGTLWFVGGWDGRPENFCVIRFTVPSHKAGVYRLESEIRPQLDGALSQDGDYHVVVNGLEVYGEFLPPNFVSGYTNVLVLAEGDTVDFLAGRGADGRQWGSGLKLQGTLSLLNTNPPFAPMILVQPQSQAVVAGTNVTLTVAVTGTPPFAYQWRKDDVALPGATESTLNLSNVQSPNIGYYSVEVTNAAGSVTSSSASLSIEGVPFGIWQGLAAFYPFNGNAADESGNGNSGTLIGTQSAQDRFGVENAAYSFNGTSDYIEIPSSPSLAFGAQITASAWICPDRLYPPQYQEGFQAMQIVGKGFDVEGAADWMFSVNGDMERPGLMLGIWTYWDSARVVESNVWCHVVFTYDGSTMKTYVDAVPSGQYSASGPFRITDGAVRIGAYAPVNGIQSKCFFSGKIDGVRIYSRALSDGDVQQLYDSEKPPAVSPGIASQSPDQTVLAGTNAVLDVGASGPTPYTFQWFFNGTNLPGVTASSLVLTNVQLEQEGLYTATVSNPYGSVTSAPIVLTVLMAPVITTQPKGLSGYWGKSATFQVKVRGSLPLSYQWFKDGIPIDWATNASLSLTNLELTDGGDYTVEVSNSVDSVVSVPAVLVVNPAGISLGLYPGVTIDGVVGKRYGIQYTTNISQTTSWTTATNFTLVQPIQLWVDTSAEAKSVNYPKRFYRVVAVP